MLSPGRSHPLPRSLQWVIAAILVLAVLAGILQKSSRAQTGESDFTVIALPDTQNEAEKFPQVLNAQTKWIADNRDALNIQMVVAEGDNINDGASTAQMQNLDAAFRLLDNAGVPYLLGIGNHDYNAFDPRSRNLAGFDQWFGPGRYSGKAYFRGNFPSGSNANTYGVLTINGKQYLFLTFEFRPRSSSLDWAESVLSANADKEAIIVDHSFVLKNGKREDLCDDQDMPASNATGQEVWMRLRKYNVIMVLSGHFTGGSGARRTDLSDTGSLVNQLFADYQDYANGGNGWLRIMTFHPASNSISVKTYSPFLNQSMTDGANQFTLAYHNPLPNSGKGSISGKVRNQSGCAAVAGINVSAGAVSTTSAADGTYSLSVAPGSYTVTASGSGWNTSSKDEKVSDSLDTQVNFYLTSGTSPTPTPTPTPTPPPSGCTAGPASPSVTICSPLNNATVTSPVRVVAATRDSVPVSFMQIYVDGSSVLTSSGGTLDKTVAMAAGTRRLTVQAKDTAGVIFKQTIYINVSNSPGPTPTPTSTPPPGPTPTPTPPPSGCTVGPASPSITICSPLNNATVTSPVRVVAATRDSVPVSFMQIYVDGSPVLTSSGGTLDKTITLAAGTRRLTVQAQDTAGVIFKQTIYITVR